MWNVHHVIHADHVIIVWHVDRNDQVCYGKHINLAVMWSKLMVKHATQLEHYSVCEVHEVVGTAGACRFC